MKKFITITFLSLLSLPLFSQISIKELVEEKWGHSSYQVAGQFVKTLNCGMPVDNERKLSPYDSHLNSSTELLFLIEDDGYIIPVRLKTNDLGAIERFRSRNLKKGEPLYIKGNLDEFIIDGHSYSGLTNAIILDNPQWLQIENRYIVGYIPRPSYNSNSEGVVVVQIKIDQFGHVKEAIPGIKGTTTKDKTLWNACRSAAIKVRFNRDGNAPELQTGTITYTFKLK